MKNMKLMKKKRQLKSSSIIILMSFLVSFPALASGGSAMSFSLYFFVFFGFVGWIVSAIVKHKTQKREDTIYIRLIRILPITLLVSPSFYIESPNAMLFPSAATLVFSVDTFNSASLISAFISMLLTTFAIYAYRYKETEIL